MRHLYLLAALAVFVAGPGRAEGKGKKYALLVGVTKYDHAALPDLKYPANDVEEMAALLKKPAAGFASVRVLNGARGKDAPTAANIRQALKDLLAKRGKDDLVLVALSGHGAQLQVSDPDGKGAAKSYPFFCPADADLLGIGYRTGEAKTLINLNTLFADLGMCGAGSKLVLIDACRNTMKVQGARRTIDTKAVDVPEGVSVLYSCSPGQVAWETGQLGKGHGVFFYHVLEGLRGKAKNDDGEVTWDTLKSHVRRQVPKTVPVVVGRDAKQVPHSVENSPGESPVLTRTTASDADEAAYRRALALYHGTGGKVGRAEAARLAKQAAEKGHAKSQVLLGWMTVGGQGTPRDAAAGRRWVERGVPGLREAAEAGDADAQAWLGTLYFAGAGVDKDDKQAIAWWRKAAEQKSAHARYYLGLAHRIGRGVPADLKAASSWWRLAAEQGHATAANALGHQHLTGQGVGKDAKEAARLFRQAADRGYGPAQVSLARLYLSGQGVTKDEAEAAKWMRKAADGGSSLARHLLGGMYADGKGVKKDDKEAVRLFRLAAEKNFPPAQSDLGWMYEQGRGVAKDEATALSWYRKAADRGHAAALHNVGLAYELGRGVKKDAAEALEWYDKAAARGHDGAKKSAERLRGNGRGK